MAFQIRDDIENIMLDQGKTGKPAGNDILDGIITLPLIYAIKENPQIKENLKYIYKKKMNYQCYELFTILELVKKTSGIQKSKDLIQKYADRGLKYLSPLKNSRYKEIFTDLINELKAEI